MGYTKGDALNCEVGRGMKWARSRACYDGTIKDENCLPPVRYSLTPG
jgi:hypothetical protein